MNYANFVTKPAPHAAVAVLTRINGQEPEGEFDGYQQPPGLFPDHAYIPVDQFLHGGSVMTPGRVGSSSVLTTPITLFLDITL